MIRGRRAWRACLALTALQALAWEAPEAKLPSWAQEVADAAPPIPERFIEDRSRVLYSFMRYEIRPDGSVEMLKRLAVQALQAYPVDTSAGAFLFRPTMRVKASRAWHLRPDARSMRSYLPPIDLLVDTAFLGDTKVKIKPVEGTRKGSIVFFEFEAVDKPYFLSITHMFYEGAPIVRARLEVAAPPGWLVRSSWLRLQGPDPVVDGGAHVWELRDLPATRSEPLGPRPADRAPFLAVQVAPPEGVVTEPATFRDWTAVSEWYEGMVAGRHEASPAVERAATQHMPESSAGFYERVLAAARYVRDSVRYVAIELGLGGWRPHAASETLANLYGDCKDKGTLFRSLLAVRGIPSYPVLINLSIPDLVSRDVPVVAFNHFVVAVPVSDDAELPASLAPAVVDAGDLGRLLFVDTTDEDTSIGYISGELAGQLGLVVAGPHGRLVRLPDERPESHRLERRIRLEIRPDGSQAIHRSSSYYGQFASIARGEYGASAVDRMEAVQQRVSRIWPGSTVRDYQVTEETPDGAFVEAVQVEVTAPAAPRSSHRIPILPGASDDIPRVSLTRRTLPVDYRHARLVRYDVEISGFPGHWSPPAPQELSGRGWRVGARFVLKEDRLVATWEGVLGKRWFEADDFAELRAFWSALAATTRWTMDLSAVDPEPGALRAPGGNQPPLRAAAQ